MVKHWKSTTISAPLSSCGCGILMMCHTSFHFGSPAAHNTTAERGADIARPTERATPYVGENDALSSQGGGRAAKKRSYQGMTRDASDYST